MTAKARLLLVEDTPSILRLYHEVLKKLDVELLDADTGARALAVLQRHDPRRRPARPRTARHQRHRNPAHDPPARPALRGHRRHRARLGQGRGRGDARRRLRFHRQAVRARPAARHGQERAGTAPAGNPRGGQRHRPDRPVLRVDRRVIADARRSTTSSKAPPRAAPPSSSPAKAAPARSFAPRRSTS